MSPRFTLLMTFLTAFAACGSSPFVRVEVDHIPDLAQSLNVEAWLDDNPANEQLQMEITNRPDFTFGIRFSETVQGHLIISVRALDGNGCLFTTADGDLIINPGDTVLPLTISLDLQPPFAQGSLNTIWGSGSGGCQASPGGTSGLYLGGETLGSSEGALVLKQQGKVWSTLGSLGGSDPIFSLWGSGPNDLWAVAAQTFHYDGSGWSYISDPGPAGPLLKVWGSSANDVWAVGDRMIHWNGTAWSLIFPANSTDYLGGLWGSSADDVWAVGTTNAASPPAGLIRHWDGKTWNNIPSAGTARLSAVWGSGPTDVWAVGGGIVHWDGTAWTAVSYPGSPGLSDVWGSGPSDVWAVGTDTSGSSSQGVLLHWDGTAWTSASPPSSAGLTAIWGSAADDVWVTGTQGIYTPVLLHWDGASWSRQPFLASP